VFDLPPAQVTDDVLEGLYRLLAPVEDPPAREVG
jgi:hypothetical protein